MRQLKTWTRRRRLRLWFRNRLRTWKHINQRFALRLDWRVEALAPQAVSRHTEGARPPHIFAVCFVCDNSRRKWGFSILIQSCSWWRMKITFIESSDKLEEKVGGEWRDDTKDWMEGEKRGVVRTGLGGGEGGRRRNKWKWTKSDV